MIKAIIVDDEKSGRDLLTALLETYCPEVKIMALASSLGDAYRAVKNIACDVLFLDIRIGKEIGLDLLTVLPDPAPFIIVTTAYKQYALQAIKAQVFDYLLKPIASDELKLSVEKVKEKINAQKSTQHNIAPEHSGERRITLGTAEGLLVVALNQIISFKANGNYTEVYLKENKKIVTSTNLGDFEKSLLETKEFLRVHHSYLINLKEIRMYLKTDGGYLLMSDESKIQASQRKKSELLKALKSLRLL